MTEPKAIIVNTTTGHASRFNSFGAACHAAAVDSITGYIVSSSDEVIRIHRGQQVALTYKPKPKPKRTK